MLAKVKDSIEKARRLTVPSKRRETLAPLIGFIAGKLKAGQPVHLNFICTHNSRRSQFSQIWAHTAAHYFGVTAHCCSGGAEVTAFNERAVEALRQDGFEVTARGSENPVYSVAFSKDAPPIKAFSKLYDDPFNSDGKFAAIMTCAHADDNCPFIPMAEARIPVRYEDPKAFDGTPLEAKMYGERSMQVASEMFYVFGEVSRGLRKF